MKQEVIRVYGSDTCPRCDDAKELLQAHDIDFDFIDVKAEGNEEHLAFLRDMGLRTIPQTFIWNQRAGEFENIGGLTELKENIDALTSSEEE